MILYNLFWVIKSRDLEDNLFVPMSPLSIKSELGGFFSSEDLTLVPELQGANTQVHRTHTYTVVSAH